MQLKLVQFMYSQAADLGIARIRVKYITEKLAGNCDTCNYQAMHIVTVDREPADAGKMPNSGIRSFLLG